MQTRRPVEMLARRYALEEELGRSGTGMVWRAHDTVLDRTVAVKLLRPDLAEDPAFIARLAEEASAVARAVAPGLVRLLDSGADRGVSFLVREHVRGESLRARLDRSGPLGTDEAIRIVAELLDTLAAVHAMGLLHLGVKPENVLLADDGRVLLADLGLGAAVVAARPGAAAELLALAPGPPELADPSVPLGPSTDVFLAGAVLAEALAGEHLGGTGSAAARRPPASLTRVVERALAADTDRRYADARTFADALRGIATQHPSAREGHGLRGWLLIPALVVGAALIAVGIGLWAGRLELGGPLGVRAAEEPPTPRPAPTPRGVVLPVAEVSTFDPYGDRHENDTGAPAAIDGDIATAWRTENYFDGDLRKPGVGLLLDLGTSRTVTGFRLATPHAGWAFGLAVGEDPVDLTDAADGVFTSETSMRVRIDPAAGRYVLLWIVSVVDVGDGDRAEVAEIRVVGPDA